MIRGLTLDASRAMNNAFFCFVHGCENNSGSLHVLPKENYLREKWAQFIWRGKTPAVISERARICSSHFQEHCFENFQMHQRGFAKMLRLKPDSIPTIYSVSQQENTLVGYVYLFLFYYSTHSHGNNVLIAC